MSFKNELKALRQIAIDTEYKVFKDKLKASIQNYLKSRVQAIDTISNNNINCCMDIGTDKVNVDKNTVLDIINLIFKELDIENDVSDIVFKYESNYQDSYYILKFTYKVD